MTDNSVGPVTHLVHVQCDMAASTLTISPSQHSLSLKAGDLVIWTFSGVSEGWVPWIEFQAGNFGPLAGLTQSQAGFWGTCRDDASLAGEKFIYRVSIQRGWGSAWTTGTATISSNTASLAVASPETGTARHFTVVREGDSLLVSPEEVTFRPGDTVEWIFDNVEDDSERPWHPVVIFQRYDGSGEVSNLYLGPHTNLTIQGNRVKGMGNNRIPGTYYFQVAAVRISDGQALWVSSGDPAIDNRGSAADPTSGGGSGY